MRTKRVLALVLALMLIISLVPVSFAADYTNYVETKSSKFMFISSAHRANSGSESVTFDKNTHEINDTDESVSSPWGFVNRYTGSGYGTKATASSWHAYTNGDTFAFTHGDNNAHASKGALAFEIEVEKAGVYYPEFTFLAEKCSPKVELYLIEKPENTKDWEIETASGDKFYSQLYSLSVNDRIGTVDLYGEKTEEKSVKLPYKLTVDEDNKRYYFVIVPNGKNPLMEEIYNASRNQTYTRVQFVSLTLSEPVKEERPTLEYDMTINAFNEMPWSYDSKNSVSGTAIGSSEWGGWGSFPGIRNVGKANQKISGYLVNTNFMNWNATTTYGASLSEILDTPKKVMNLEKTDPWAYVASKTSGSFYIDTTAGKEGIFTNWLYSEGTFTSNQSGTYAFLKVRVPYAGKYILSARSPKFDYGGIAGVHFLSEEKANSYAGPYTLITNEPLVGWFSAAPLSALSTIEGVSGISDISINDVGEDGYSVIGEVNAPTAGDYYVCFDPKKESYYKNKNYITSSGKNYHYFYLSGVKLTPVAEDMDTINAENAEYNRVTSVEAPSGISEDKVIPAAINVTTIAADIHGKSVSADVSATVSGKVISATATDVDGYEFLYWTKDIGKNKKTISTEKNCEFIASPGNNILTAVYRNKKDEETTAIFYDGNGDEIGRVLLEGDSVIMPALPARTGWKPSDGWKLHGGDDTLYAAGESVAARGSKMLFVANYEELSEVNITANGAHTVKVNGETRNGVVSCLYGDKITVTAYKREGGSGEKIFNYWKKNGEIVSFDQTYTFNAADDCTVEAVYEKYEPINKNLQRIILTTFATEDKTSVVAEYLITGNVAEKGILFGSDINSSKKAIMRSDGNSFAMINDIETPAVGYAILADGSVIYSK